MKSKILAISGSLRAASFNTALLRAASDISPDMAWDFAAIGDLPHYNPDLDQTPGPEAVERVKGQVRAADALLFSSPEYNYSISGVLKNAIDWLSRPAYGSVLVNKPVGIIGASPGAVGTARAQSHLKQILSGVLAPVFVYPEFLVGQAGSRFTDGKLTDEKTRELLKQYLDAFGTWVNKTTLKA